MVWIAFTLGIFGSLHCLGMCGPLALGFSSMRTADKNSKWQKALTYNLGRILAYTTMGIIFGLFGTIVLVAGFQQSLSLLLGIVFIVLFLGSFNLEHSLNKIAVFKRWHTAVSRFLQQAYRYSGKYPIWVLGFANGLLPCGLVYLALAGAVASGGVFSSVLFMLLFGIGTLPAMILVMAGGSWVSPSIRLQFRKVVPLVHLFFGFYLMYRGMVIEVPAEINFWEAIKNPVMCH